MLPHPQPLDEDTAARLLQGVVHPDDAPPGYWSVADVLGSAARLPLAPIDEQKAVATVAAMVEAIPTAAPAPQASRRTPMLKKLLAGKALAAVAVLGLTATGAAAATGSLPDHVQGVVADAIDNVGVRIPHPNHGKSAEHRQDGDRRKDGHDGQKGQPDDGGQPAGDNSGQPEKGMSQFVEEHKGGEGPLGQVVCVEASDGKCHSAENNPGKGGGNDDATPPSSGPAENNGKGHQPSADGGEATPPVGDDDSGAPPSGDGDDARQGTAPTPASTGGVETGVTNSGKDIPLGKGKPADG